LVVIERGLLRDCVWLIPVPGVNLLVEMAESDEAEDPTEERRNAAFDALHRMLGCRLQSIELYL
jgi:hypothetical protein